MRPPARRRHVPPQLPNDPHMRWHYFHDYVIRERNKPCWKNPRLINDLSLHVKRLDKYLEYKSAKCVRASITYNLRDEILDPCDLAHLKTALDRRWRKLGVYTKYRNFLNRLLPSGVWFPLEEDVVHRHCRTRIGYLAVSRCRKSSASSSSWRWRCAASSSAVALDLSSTAGAPEAFEAGIERAVYGCRFMTLLGVSGSLVGSLLCFIKGCTYVVQSFAEYMVIRGKVILFLVEAIDVYLLGTVMLVFGMGLYELFICNLDIAKTLSKGGDRRTSNLFGIFTLKERPKWLEIKSVNELKTKLGQVIVMLLLIGLFDKSKKAAISTSVDLLCFSAAVLLSSGCLYLLSKLNGSD